MNLAEILFWSHFFVCLEKKTGLVYFTLGRDQIGIRLFLVEKEKQMSRQTVLIILAPGALVFLVPFYKYYK